MQKIDPILLEICTKVLYEFDLMKEKDKESSDSSSNIEDTMGILNAFTTNPKQLSNNSGKKYNLQTNLSMKSK
jgi:hypothetical protein